MKEADWKKIIGKNIKKYRALKDLTGEALGNKVGLRKETISRVENGAENLGLDKLIKIIEILEIYPGELFMNNPSWIPMRFVVSDKNVEVFKKIIEQFDISIKEK